MAWTWRFHDLAEVRSPWRCRAHRKYAEHLFLLSDVLGQKLSVGPAWGLPLLFRDGEPEAVFGRRPPPHVLPFTGSLTNYFTRRDHKAPEIGDLLNFIFPSIHCTWQVLNEAYLINFRIMYLLLLPSALIFLFKSQHPLNLSVNILCSLQASS